MCKKIFYRASLNGHQFRKVTFGLVVKHAPLSLICWNQSQLVSLFSFSALHFTPLSCWVSCSYEPAQFDTCKLVLYFCGLRLSLFFPYKIIWQIFEYIRIIFYHIHVFSKTNVFNLSSVSLFHNKLFEYLFWQSWTNM